MAKDKELMVALGIPEDSEMEEAPDQEDASYLSKKPAELKGYLMDATDPSLTPAQRAEALCRAIEFKPEAVEVEVEEAPVDEYLDEE